MKCPRIYIIILVLTSFVLGGCKGISASQVALFPDQSVLLSNPNLCRIYVLRDSSTFLAAWQAEIYDGDTYIGGIEPHTYLCWERQPDKTVISTAGHQQAYFIGTTPGFLSAISQPKLSLDLEKGKIYYIRHYLYFGESLKLLSAEEGKKRLKDCSPPAYKRTRNE